MAFRRSFALASAPSKAVTRIAADSKYWLWVNGTLVVFDGQLKRGPNRTDTYYDEVDLGPYLTSGNNTVALLVWYFGKQGFSHNGSGKGGLLFQSDITTGSNTARLVSDTSWKHTVHPGYSNNTSGTQVNSRLPESNVYYDARNATAMTGWESLRLRRQRLERAHRLRRRGRRALERSGGAADPAVPLLRPEVLHQRLVAAVHRPGLHRHLGNPAVQHPGHSVPEGRRSGRCGDFDRVLWNASKNEYRSPGYTKDTDDRANALAVVAGLAPASRHRAVTEVLRTHLNASPYMEFYVLEALYLMGAATVAEERMRNRFAAQVADPTCYTLWELWGKAAGTDNHAWNGGPLYALSAYVAGVRPTKPGWTTYDVIPQTGTLTKVNTVTPTVRGDIRFGIDRAADKVTLTLTSPSGTTARVGVPTYGGSQPVIQVNGTTVYTGGSATGNVSGLTYASKDTSYVYFTLQPGTWTFTVTGAGRLDNLALGRSVSSNNSLENSNWGRSRLTDGKLTSVTGANPTAPPRPTPSPRPPAAICA
ncbi:alpha-L-rhamnosidase C-terminal domain-containing protein [Streptomyces sp. NPDC002888]|uniref:alpha-L-rhamnosidase C-terminal domain-containing protein n=1 Tax=Streptomyces sp. NPDC002888 TaxID=3364668 RepID=UPI0036CAD427